MPPHVIGQQSFVIGGERRRNALFQCVTVAGHQVDPKCCSQSEEIASCVPDSRLLVVPRAAHLANAERPDVITPALINHLEQS